jgi:MFS family permease
LLLWTAGHFGILAVLPLFLLDQGYDARSIGFTLGAAGIAQLCVRPFAGWVVDAFGRRVCRCGRSGAGSQIPASSSSVRKSEP